MIESLTSAFTCFGLDKRMSWKNIKIVRRSFWLGYSRISKFSNAYRGLARDRWIAHSRQIRQLCLARPIFRASAHRPKPTPWVLDTCTFVCSAEVANTSSNHQVCCNARDSAKTTVATLHGSPKYTINKATDGATSGSPQKLRRAHRADNRFEKTTSG